MGWAMGGLVHQKRVKDKSESPLVSTVNNFEIQLKFCKVLILTFISHNTSLTDVG